MPIHDWSRVVAGVFHHFHLSWTQEVARALNGGGLPPDFYALAEQAAGVANAPSEVEFTAQSELDYYTRKQDHLTIRHANDDRVVALVEIVSTGNKGTKRHLHEFVENASIALFKGLHLLVVDLFSPGTRDPNGIHAAIWDEIDGDSQHHSADKPLTLAAYDAGPPVTAYVEPVAVGDVLPEMPLFLRPGHYVNVPLEATYQRAYESVPGRWRRVLEEQEASG